jgi:hypothetical protein
MFLVQKIYAKIVKYNMEINVFHVITFNALVVPLDIFGFLLLNSVYPQIISYVMMVFGLNSLKLVMMAILSTVMVVTQIVESKLTTNVYCQTSNHQGHLFVDLQKISL